MRVLLRKNRTWNGTTLPAALAALFLLLGVSEARAQTDQGQPYTVVLRDVPLAFALARLASAAGMNLIYDSNLVEDVTVFCVLQNAPADELLRCVLSGTGLDYFRTSSGTYVLTRSVREPPLYGQFVGVVVDGETGEPLPYANVLLADAGMGTAANEAGRFSFSMLKPGPYRVVMTYVGYEPRVDSVWISPGGPTHERFALNARSVTAEPVVITGLQHRVPSQALGTDRLTGMELSSHLNRLGAADVAGGTASLLGFTVQEPWADLYLQGGEAGELQMRIDGVPVRNPVTLGHLLGAFSPLAIERMTVHKAGFSAAHGSHLSGTIAAEHALSRTEHRHVTAQFDPLSFNGRGQASWNITRDVNARAMVAARTSLWPVHRDATLSELLKDWHIIDPLLAPAAYRGMLQPETADHRAHVSFSDLHAATRVHFGPLHTVHGSIYRGDNKMESEAVVNVSGGSPSDADFSRDTYRWTSTAGQVRYEGLLGARLLGTLALYSSRQFLGHGYVMPPVEADPYSDPAEVIAVPYDGNWVDETGLEAGFDLNIERRHNVSGALSLTRTASRAVIYNDFFRHLDQSSSQWRVSGYLQDQFSAGLRTTIELGTRVTYIPDRQTLYAEPRLALRYDGHHARLGDYAFRLAGGVYRQFVNEFDLSSTGPMGILPFIRFWLPVDESLAPPRAYHFAADVLWKPGDVWQVNFEGYYKAQPHLLAIDYPALLSTYHDGGEGVEQASLIASTDGRAFGGDLRIRYSTQRVKSAVSYSLMRAERRFPGRFADRYQPAPWEQPHRLSVENTVGVARDLALRLNWRSVWGRSWAFRRAYYDFLAPQGALMDAIPFDLNDPSAQRLPPLHQLDAGLSFEHTVGDFSVVLSAKILNLLDRRNAVDWSLRESADGFEKITRTLPGRRPVFSMRLSF